MPRRCLSGGRNSGGMELGRSKKGLCEEAGITLPEGNKEYRPSAAGRSPGSP